MNALKLIVGKTYNRLTVISSRTKRRNGCITWLCVCKCGTKKYVTGRSLIQGTTKSCGCLKSEIDRTRGIKDLTNRVFGRLKVLHGIHVGLGSHKWRWVCKCTCGKVVRVRSGDLKTGDTKSCGCLFIERLKKRQFKHGQTIGGQSDEYVAWCNMRSRCYNIANEKYKDYGGRGIKVCQRWLHKKHGFQYFFKDVGKKPKKLYSLGRIDNDGNYEPKNVRWETPLQQSRNKRPRKRNEYSRPKD